MAARRLSTRRHRGVARGRFHRARPPRAEPAGRIDWVTVAQPKSIDDGAPGVIVAESAVSSINKGKLAYRGYPIEEIVAHASFEEVCLLLWSGDRPVAEEIAALRAEIHGAQMPPSVAEALAAVGDDAPPLLRLAALMPSLAAWIGASRRARASIAPS